MAGASRCRRIVAIVHTFSSSIAIGLEGSLARYYVTYRGNYGRYASSSAARSFPDRPKTRALLQIRRGDISHEAERMLDNVAMQYFAGVAWEALPTLQGSVRLGYMTKRRRCAWLL